MNRARTAVALLTSAALIGGALPSGAVAKSHTSNGTKHGVKCRAHSTKRKCSRGHHGHHGVKK